MDLADAPYLVGPMLAEDVHTVAMIEQRVFSMPWSENSFRYEATQADTSEYLVARYLPWMASSAKVSFLASLRKVLQPDQEDASLLGYGGSWFVVDEAHITTLAVRAEWRGRGLGELLLVSLIERAIRRRAELVTLEVRASNLLAQNLYQKYGFRKVGRRKGYYTDDHEDAHIMTIEPLMDPAYQQQFEGLCRQLVERLGHAEALPPPSVAHSTA
jgi:[ribosomal protein S18]-alanine N-acetyltransferase